MEDCGCEDDKFSLDLKSIDFKEGVGENIFENNDIFDKVKNYYKDYKNDFEEEDLLLENLNKPEKDEFGFVEELKNIKLTVSYKDEDEGEVEEREIIISNENDDKKINYIKTYLDKLKNGTD